MNAGTFRERESYRGIGRRRTRSKSKLVSSNLGICSTLYLGGSIP